MKQRRSYRPSKVLVFGSRARGDALKHSDLEDCDIQFGVELLCYTHRPLLASVKRLRGRRKNFDHWDAPSC